MKASMQHKQSSPKAKNDIFSSGKHGKDLQDIFTGLFKGLLYGLVVCYIERFLTFIFLLPTLLGYYNIFSNI